MITTFARSALSESAFDPNIAVFGARISIPQRKWLISEPESASFLRSSILTPGPAQVLGGEAISGSRISRLFRSGRFSFENPPCIEESAASEGEISIDARHADSRRQNQLDARDADFCTKMSNILGRRRFARRDRQSHKNRRFRGQNRPFFQGIANLGVRIGDERKNCRLRRRNRQSPQSDADSGARISVTQSKADCGVGIAARAAFRRVRHH